MIAVLWFGATCAGLAVLWAYDNAPGASDRKIALAAGGDDFDTKPIRFQQLLAKIEALLTRDSRR